MKKYTKAIVSGVATAVVLIVSVATDGVSNEEWVYVVSTVLGTLGVYQLPNKRNTPVDGAVV